MYEAQSATRDEGSRHDQTGRDRRLAPRRNAGKPPSVPPPDEARPRHDRGRSSDGYGAWAPDLPGCVAVGDTPDETEREMRAAITYHLEGMLEDGLAVLVAATS